MNRGFNVVGTLRVPSARTPRAQRVSRVGVTAHGVCLLHGFTLLEIILSLAILAGALAALGEVMRLADQSATTTEEETRAQILAASLMDELVAGAREVTAVNGAAFDEEGVDPSWVYSIELDPTAYDALVAVRVRVEQNLDAQLQPAHFDLVRWLPNPNYTPPESSDQQSSSSGSSSSSSSGSGGSQK